MRSRRRAQPRGLATGYVRDVASSKHTEGGALMHGVSELGAFVCGIGGGIAPELVKMYKIRELPQMPQWFKSPIFWGLTLAMILAGGGLATLYAASGSTLSPILAVNVGASAPLILSTLSSNAPELPLRID
jgi:hypothetical protein